MWLEKQVKKMYVEGILGFNIHKTIKSEWICVIVKDFELSHKVPSHQATNKQGKEISRMKMKVAKILLVPGK